MNTKINSLPANRMQMQEVMYAGFVEVLLKMQRRTNDRDASTKWAEYDSFADYYAANKWMFCVGFSASDKMVAKVVRNYLVHQTRRVTTGRSEKFDIGLYTAMLDGVITSNFSKIKAVLADLYPAELQDIIERNNTPVFC
jgi:hypothetical protein